MTNINGTQQLFSFHGGIKILLEPIFEFLFKQETRHSTSIDEKELQVRQHFFLSLRVGCFKSMNAEQKQEIDPMKKKHPQEQGDEDVHLLVVFDGYDCSDEHQHHLKGKEEESSSSSWFQHYYKMLNQALLSFSHTPLLLVMVAFIAGMFCSELLASTPPTISKAEQRQVTPKSWRSFDLRLLLLPLRLC